MITLCLSIIYVTLVCIKFFFFSLLGIVEINLNHFTSHRCKKKLPGSLLRELNESVIKYNYIEVETCILRCLLINDVLYENQTKNKYNKQIYFLSIVLFYLFICIFCFRSSSVAHGNFSSVKYKKCLMTFFFKSHFLFKHSLMNKLICFQLVIYAIVFPLFTSGK